MQGLNGIRTIIIGNDREFFSPVDRFVPPHLQTEYFESDLDEADMDIMWEGDNKLAIMPRHLDLAWVNDVRAFFGYKNFHLLVPQEKTGLCSDILTDQAVMSVLVETIRLNPGLQIIPFGNTPQFYNLVDTLAQMGLSFVTPETPQSQNRWVVTHFDTKVGCRELLTMAAQRNSLIHLPDGFIVTTLAKGEQAARNLVKSGRGVVYKANEGGSGIGVNVFPPQKFVPRNGFADMVRQIRSNPLYTGGDPFIVEEYVRPDFTHHGVFPSVDARIYPNGKIVIEAVDAMVIRHEENEVGFYGCVAGMGLFTKSQIADLYSMTMTIGQILKELGYVGWFDTDYILSPDGTFTPTEANIRSTSMRYMVEYGKKVFGNNFASDSAMRSNDKYIRPDLFGVSYLELKRILADLLYPIKSKKRGIIISESMRSKFNRGKFGYCILGTDQADTKAIEDAMEVRLNRI